MEVHHHAHTPRRKWTHYFWEFLMLFLAVFCGFLAENIREHRIEHQREKQFMRSMLEDLRSDTSLLSFASRYWDTINLSIDSLANAIQIPVAPGNEAKSYQFINKGLDYFSFNVNDRTISQLKNSGSFRLIRNDKVANKIILFDQFNNDAMKNIAELRASFYLTTMQLGNKVFVQEIINELFKRNRFARPGANDMEWVDSILQKNKNPLPAQEYNAALFELKNALQAYRKDYSNLKFGYDNLKAKMDELIQLIQEEYHLK
ncbi:MAG TPA: hypothetical protein VFH08_12815 [Chitinophagaceae bacterium]|nr:hypothetical protein [Chitinophagaceae bacterium]